MFLFCIAEQAKPLARKALNIKHGAFGTYFLVESYNGPGDGQNFKRELADNESFETDFIGASEQDCRKWALENQYQDNLIMQDIIAIADHRSASDDTLSVQFYNREPGFELEGEGMLPRETDKWYDFRVPYKEAEQVYVALTSISCVIAYPVYFGRKDELTNELGIFNVAEADELILNP